MVKKLLFTVGFVVLFCAGLVPVSFSGEIKPIANFGPFYFERPAGELGFSLREDLQKISSGKNKITGEYRLMNEELRIEERFFIYHKRFVGLKVGGGIAFGQGLAEYQGADLAKNFGIDGYFLKETPYGGSFFFQRRLADIGHTPNMDYLADQKHGGLTFDLGKTVVGWPLNFRFDVFGSDASNVFRGNKSLVDYDFDIHEERKSFEADTEKQWEKVSVNLNFREQLYSRRFSLNQKEHESDYVSHYFHGTAAGKFLDNTLRTKTSLSLNSRNGVSDYSGFALRQEQRFWIFRDKLQKLDSFVSFGASQINREVSGGAAESEWLSKEENAYEARGGFSHQLGESLFTEVEAGREKKQFSAFEQTLDEKLARVDYAKQIFPAFDGKLSLGYEISSSDLFRAGEEHVFVSGEMHKISDYEAVMLEGQEISTESVVVTDISGTIIYQEGADYRIYKLGSPTYVERIPGTRILNGETVLVGYENFVPRGLARNTVQTVSARISLFDGLAEPHFRLRNVEQNTTGGSGSAYNQLSDNSGQNRSFGLDSRYAFERWRKAEITSGIDFEDNAQLNYPFHRATSRFSLTIPVNEKLRLTWQGGRSDIDYRKTEQNDIRLLNSGINAIFETVKTRVMAGVTYDSSAIGKTERNVSALQLAFSHEVRQLSVNVFIRRALEKYEVNKNNTERDGFLFRINLARHF